MFVRKSVTARHWNRKLALVAVFLKYQNKRGFRNVELIQGRMKKVPRMQLTALSPEEGV